MCKLFQILVLVGLVFSCGCLASKGKPESFVDLGACRFKIPGGFSESDSGGMFMQDYDLGVGKIRKKSMGGDRDIFSDYPPSFFLLADRKSVGAVDVYFFEYSVDGVSKKEAGVILSGKVYVEILGMDRGFVESVAASCI